MASQPFYVSKDFERQLTEYDRKLRVRWDHKYAYWRIERRVAQVWEQSPTSPAEWQAKADGYALVMQVPPDCLDFQVFKALELRDIQKQGGALAYAKRLEAGERAQMAASRAAFQDHNEQRAKERWTSWNTNYPQTKTGRSWDARGGSLGRG